jgi:hypothetical protein
MNGKQQNMHQVVTSVWIQNHGWQNQNAGERLVIDSLCWDGRPAKINKHRPVRRGAVRWKEDTANARLFKTRYDNYWQAPGATQ